MFKNDKNIHLMDYDGQAVQLPSANLEIWFLWSFANFLGKFQLKKEKEFGKRTLTKATTPHLQYTKKFLWIQENWSG